MDDGAYNGRAQDPHRGAQANGSLLRAAPGIFRIAGGVGVRTVEWTLTNYVRAMTRLARAAVDGQSAADLLQDAGGELRTQIRRVLGVDSETDPLSTVPDEDEIDDSDHPAEPLRRRGAELLNRSADVEFEEETHPAYARILTQLTPDEARILRLLETEGPQASIDVRTWRPFNVGDELVEGGLTMIGAEAGCRYLERVPSHLNNLYRLGLIWFSREAIDDLSRYQVLEAQPDAGEAMKKAGRARTIRRSIRLTPFGQDFCDACIPADTGEFEAIRRDAASAGNGRPAEAGEDGVPASAQADFSLSDPLPRPRA